MVNLRLRPDQNVQAERAVGHGEFDGLSHRPLAVRRVHHHQQIHVTPRLRPAISVRAEEDDLIRVELLGDDPGEGADGAHGHALAAMDVRYVKFV